MTNEENHDAAFLECIMWVGGRVLIDEAKFFQWIRKCNGEQYVEHGEARIIPLASWNKFHPWPTSQSLRNRIHAAKRGTKAA